MTTKVEFETFELLVSEDTNEFAKVASDDFVSEVFSPVRVGFTEEDAFFSPALNQSAHIPLALRHLLQPKPIADLISSEEVERTSLRRAFFTDFRKLCVKEFVQPYMKSLLVISTKWKIASICAGQERAWREGLKNIEAGEFLPLEEDGKRMQVVASWNSGVRSLEFQKAEFIRFAAAQDRERERRYCIRQENRERKFLFIDEICAAQWFAYQFWPGMYALWQNEFFPTIESMGIVPRFFIDEYLARREISLEAFQAFPRFYSLLVIGIHPGESTDRPPFRRRVAAIYQKYQPEKYKEFSPTKATDVLQKYRGKENALIRALVKKYGPEPEVTDLSEQDKVLSLYETLVPEEAASVASAIDQYDPASSDIPEKEFLQQLLQKLPKIGLARMHFSRELHKYVATLMLSFRQTVIIELLQRVCRGYVVRQHHLTHQLRERQRHLARTMLHAVVKGYFCREFVYLKILHSEKIRLAQRSRKSESVDYPLASHQEEEKHEVAAAETAEEVTIASQEEEEGKPVEQPGTAVNDRDNESLFLTERQNLENDEGNAREVVNGIETLSHLELHDRFVIESSLPEEIVSTRTIFLAEGERIESRRRSVEAQLFLAVAEQEARNEEIREFPLQVDEIHFHEIISDEENSRSAIEQDQRNQGADLRTHFAALRAKVGKEAVLAFKERKRLEWLEARKMAADEADCRSRQRQISEELVLLVVHELIAREIFHTIVDERMARLLVLEAEDQRLALLSAQRRSLSEGIATFKKHWSRKVDQLELDEEAERKVILDSEGPHRFNLRVDELACRSDIEENSLLSESGKDKAVPFHEATEPPLEKAAQKPSEPFDKPAAIQKQQPDFVCVTGLPEGTCDSLPASALIKPELANDGLPVDGAVVAPGASPSTESHYAACKVLHCVVKGYFCRTLMHMRYSRTKKKFFRKT